MIISLVNQKGGVGKTTLAINIASFIAINKSKKVLLIDGDSQGSVLQWQSIAGNNTFGVIHHPEPSFHKKINALVSGYDHVVIDSPPFIGDITRSILMVCDSVIVPIGPSPLDIWSSKETISLVQQAQKHNQRLAARLLIAKKIVGTRVGKDARNAMAKYKIPLFSTEISQRVAFVEAMIQGLSVLQYEPTGAAAVEIRSLGSEII